MTRCSFAIFCLLIVGCHGCRPTTPGGVDIRPAQTGVAKIEATNADASGHVQRAMPHADNIGQTELGGATAALAEQKTEIGTVKESLQVAEKQAVALQRRCEKSESDLAWEQDHWFGYKTRRLAKWIIGIWVALGILGMLLKGFGGGWVFSVGRFVLSMLPAAWPFLKVTDWITSKRR